MTTDIESFTRDKIEFGKSQKQLHDNLLRDYVYDGNSVIIALSRKGPKMVNDIFTESEQSSMNIVTEFAIPLLFARMSKDQHYNIYILDDAVYYGSTLLNLFREVKFYESVYHLDLSVRAYVAIRDDNALKYRDLQVFAQESWRPGYGHYFVREAMSRFRNLHQCMEVEFPSVTYSFSHPIDEKSLYSLFSEIFGEDRCYEEHYDEGDVLNVLLKQRDSQFTKMRFYIDGSQLHVTMMSPRIIPNDDMIICRLMNDMDYGTKQLWAKICQMILDEEGEIWTSMTYKRNKRRNIVSLANFIFSYHEYIYNKVDIETALKRYDHLVKCNGLEKSAIYQLIGEKDISDELAHCLNNQSSLVDYHFSAIPSIPLSLKGQIYEELRNPSEEQRKTLESHNQHMVRNSYTYQEALSAVFFNQNLFVERWSRTKFLTEDRHLWFGYTHDSLLQMLEQFGRFEYQSNLVLKLHQWLDCRIDMGCVVPQYILDYNTNQWVRVFRPGENEDVVLSHLSRFVIHVYNKIDNSLRLGYVPILFFKNMLAVIYKKFWAVGLKEQFCYDLLINEDNEVCLDEEGSHKKPEIIKYLTKMYILDNSEGEITIAPRITDTEFKENTTLDIDVLETVDIYIDEILNYFEQSALTVDRAYSIFNYYLNADLSDKQLKDVYQKIASEMLQATKMIDTAIDIGDNNFVSNDCHKKLIECYHQLLRYHDDIILYYPKEKINSDDYWKRFETDIRFQTHLQIDRMLFILNLLISIYAIGHYDGVKTFFEKINKDGYVEMLGLSFINKYIGRTLSENNLTSLHKSHSFTHAIQHELSEIAA